MQKEVLGATKTPFFVFFFVAGTSSHTNQLVRQAGLVGNVWHKKVCNLSVRAPQGRVNVNKKASPQK